MSEAARVLVVEDDFLVCEMIEAVLGQLKLVLAGKATDGRAAVAMTEELRPDVVLMDIKLPVMDGVEAARLIRERCPTPVVALTAYETPGLARQMSEAGAGAYVLKPPKAAELERAICIARARFGDLMALHQLNRTLEQRSQELEVALEHVKTLRGLIPICSYCKNIRDDQGYWHGVESYVRDHTEATFTHGLCPDCYEKMRAELMKGSS